MNHGKALTGAAFVVVLLLSSIGSAQTPKSRPKPTTKPNAPAAKPTPTPASTARASAQPAQPAPPAGTLALVNGQPIMLSDLDAKVRQSIEGLDKEVEEMRGTALDDQIGTYLLEAEAKKRKVTLQQLLDAEVSSRVTPPTEAETRAFFNANRAQLASDDYNSVRQQLSDYLREQSVQKLIGEYVNRLRLTTSVTMGADLNAPGNTAQTVLATVGGRAITKGYLEERLKPYVYKRRLEVFTDELAALNYRIYETLLDAEAKRRNTTREEVFRLEVTEKLKAPSESDITKFYEENKSRIQGDLSALHDQISNFLLQQEQRRLVFDLNQRLRASANLQVLLTEPEAPVQAVSTDDDPSRGDANAPVTVVVFTDFQCPVCAATHPIIDETLKAYGNRVRLVVRDFPLPMHNNARKAAEAAAAAAAQGKFFEYINVLFRNQSALDTPSLKKYAADLGLDAARFNTALDTGQYAAEVEHDIDDGNQYGIEGTPTIFVNGVRLRDLTAEAFKAAIDRALARPGTQTAAPQRATK
jgi:protein-disulfide isomerase